MNKLRNVQYQFNEDENMIFTFLFPLFLCYIFRDQFSPHLDICACCFMHDNEDIC